MITKGASAGYWLALCVLCTLGFISCTDKLELPVKGERKIVLLGELVANDSIHFRAGQSIGIRDGAKGQMELVENLSISVNDGSRDIPLSGAPDDLTFTEFTIPYSAAEKIMEGRTYEVTATHSAMGKARVRVQIPRPFTADVTGGTTVMHQGDSCVYFKININDDAAAGNNYVIEVLQQPYTIEGYFYFNGQWLRVVQHFQTYDSLKNAGANVPEKQDTLLNRGYNRLYFYTTDEASEHLINGTPTAEAKRLLLRDKNFVSPQHKSDIYIPKRSMGTPFPELGYRTIIQVKSIAPDYFLFLEAYEQFDPYLRFNNTAVPVKIPGNIENGVGMIGAVFRIEFRYDL
jgi:hypothetical protein